MVVVNDDDGIIDGADGGCAGIVNNDMAAVSSRGAVCITASTEVVAMALV